MGCNRLPQPSHLPTPLLCRFRFVWPGSIPLGGFRVWSLGSDAHIRAPLGPLSCPHARHLVVMAFRCFTFPHASGLQSSLNAGDVKNARPAYVSAVASMEAWCAASGVAPYVQGLWYDLCSQCPPHAGFLPLPFVGRGTSVIGHRSLCKTHGGYPDSPGNRAPYGVCSRHPPGPLFRNWVTLEGPKMHNKMCHGTRDARQGPASDRG